MNVCATMSNQKGRYVPWFKLRRLTSRWPGWRRIKRSLCNSMVPKIQTSSITALRNPLENIWEKSYFTLDDYTYFCPFFRHCKDTLMQQIYIYVCSSSQGTGTTKTNKQTLTYVCRRRIDHVVQWEKACGVKRQKRPLCSVSVDGF